MKRIYTLLVMVLFTFGLFTTQATAQNRIFEKYSDMDDVEYICITKSMLKLMSLGGDVNINGVNVKGVTDAIKILLIVNSENQEVCKQMKKDFNTISTNDDYEMLMMVKNNKEKVYTLFNDHEKNKELVMYIDDADSQTFIIMTGALTKEIINSIMNND